MIDIENKIYTLVVTNLRNKINKDISTNSEMFNAPSKFPHVSISEINNYPYSKTRDSYSIENHAVVLYDINIYSNKLNGHKSEIKKILSVIDDVLYELGFSRLSKTYAPTMNNSIFRVNARYEAIVAKDNQIYRRT